MTKSIRELDMCIPFHVYVPLIPPELAPVKKPPRIGIQFQAEIPSLNSHVLDKTPLKESPEKQNTEKIAGDLLWDPTQLPFSIVDEYLSKVETYWHAFTIQKLTTKHIEKALYILHGHNYNIEDALDFMMCHPNDFFPPTINQSWNTLERCLFRTGTQRNMFDKDFYHVAKMMKTKSTSEVVEYYYWIKHHEEEKEHDRLLEDLRIRAGLDEQIRERTGAGAETENQEKIQRFPFDSSKSLIEVKENYDSSSLKRTLPLITNYADTSAHGLENGWKKAKKRRKYHHFLRNLPTQSDDSSIGEDYNQFTDKTSFFSDWELNHPLNFDLHSNKEEYENHNDDNENQDEGQAINPLKSKTELVYEQNHEEEINQNEMYLIDGDQDIVTFSSRLEPPVSPIPPCGNDFVESIFSPNQDNNDCCFNQHYTSMLTL